MRIVVLSTAQEVVNLIGVDAVLRQAEAGAEVKVDVLQTTGAATRPWGRQLAAVLSGRSLRAELRPLASLGVVDEFDPFEICDRLVDAYRDVPVVAWVYSGAQKAQSAGMFAAFSVRVNEEDRRDTAVNVELGPPRTHLLRAGDTNVTSPTDVRIAVSEFAVLYGRNLLRWRYDLAREVPIWPSEWGPAPVPFSVDEIERTPVARGAYRVTPGRSPRGHPWWSDAFELAVAIRVRRFLLERDHAVHEALFDVDRQAGPQHDFLLSLRSGRLVGLDAKSGLSDTAKFRSQQASHAEIAGSHNQFWWVIPWFPDYLSPANADFAWDPSAGANPPPGYQSLWAAWKQLDADFGQDWSGPRPPDHPGDPAFHHSRVIPFDAGTAFEQRLERILG